MEKIYSYLPYTFRQELFLLDFLKQDPENYLGALKTIKEQTTLWVYAYASYLFNLHLSKLIREGMSLPGRLPLLLHPEHSGIPTYNNALQKNGIQDMASALLPLFGYNPIDMKNTCATKAKAAITGYKILDNAVVIAFELPQGSYATTFLSHLFEVYRGLPLPPWLNTEKYDGKKLLGTGSVKSVENVLGKYMFSLADKTSLQNEAG